MATSIEFNLPGSSFEELNKIVHAYSTFSSKVGLNDVEKVSGIAATTISRSAKFLVDVGVLTSGSQKMCTDIGRRLGRAIEHKVLDDSRMLWRDCIQSNEKISKLITTIRIKGGMTEKAFSDHVLYVSGSKASSSNKTGARCVTDILIDAGLISELDGKLSVLTSQEQNSGASIVPSEYVQKLGDDSSSFAIKPADEGFKQQASEAFIGASSGPQISINIQLHLPDSKDPEIYAEIFKAMRMHLFPQ